MHARKTLIAALVVITAVLAPSALAQRDDRSGTAEPPISAAQQSSSTRPDDRAGWRGAYEPQHAAATSNGRPDDRAGIRGPEPLTPNVVQVTSTGFDWGDAFIGGLGGVGTALALMGILLLVTSRRSRARIA